MKLSRIMLAATSIMAFTWMPAYATEPGGAPQQSQAGGVIGSSAAAPPPGIYMFNQVFTYQANLAGPLTNTIGKNTGVQAAVDVQGFIFVPGWTFLGATYDAVIVQPFVMSSVGSPVI